MGGGLIQLTNTGAQDIYLTGNPQITYFKIVYRRHTNFSIESIEQVNTGNILAGSDALFNISRYGDLMHKCVLEIPIYEGMIDDTAPNNLGHAIISEISIDIGGHRIDKQSGCFMEIMSELNEPVNDLVLSQNMKNGSLTIFNSQFQYLACAGGVRNASSSDFNTLANYKWEDYTRDRKNIYVPLRFWFCDDIGQSIPLIALQYSEVFINISFTDFGDIGDKIFNLKGVGGLTLYVDYIYLDNEERKRFAQISHEYLITTVQTIEKTSINKLFYKLEINNPVKEIIWCGSSVPLKEWGKNGSFSNICSIETKWHLSLNGAKRMPERHIDYYTNYQPYVYHKNRAAQLTNGSDTNAIAVYSFALKPDEHQPSGTCNFSLFDEIYLQKSNVNSVNGTNNYYIFAITYNILRIMSGMGGLAYSN
tara:strand:- start:2130 stop:3392 length:1263 start_codon:yes stop_codon:yes gene_type:complete